VRVRLVFWLQRFIACQSGATAIEYGLIAAGIAAAVISTVNGVGLKLKTSFSSVSTQLK
jgi:pilus assembly protein Flp/PilA